MVLKLLEIIYEYYCFKIKEIRFLKGIKRFNPKSVEKNRMEVFKAQSGEFDCNNSKPINTLAATSILATPDIKRKRRKRKQERIERVLSQLAAAVMPDSGRTIRGKEEKITKKILNVFGFAGSSVIGTVVFFLVYFKFFS